MSQKSFIRFQLSVWIHLEFKTQKDNFFVINKE